MDPTFKERYEEAEQDNTYPSTGYWCVVCNRFLSSLEPGLIVHDAVPHPESMTFDEQERPQ